MAESRIIGLVVYDDCVFTCGLGMACMELRMRLCVCNVAYLCLRAWCECIEVWLATCGLEVEWSVEKANCSILINKNDEGEEKERARERESTKAREEG